MINLPYQTYLYFVGQAINLTAAVMSVTMAAIVGSMLAPQQSLSTLPYGFQFLFVMLATYPVAKMMERVGRKKSFLVGVIPLAAAGMTGFAAVEYGSFSALIASHALLGIYIAFGNFSRFAATDNLKPSLKPKALSLVVAGGVLAAVLGPALTELFREVPGYSLFSLCYAALTGLAIVLAFVMVSLPRDPMAGTNRQVSTTASVVAAPSPQARASVLIAISASALGYGVMNLLMLQASSHMVHLGEEFGNIKFAIQLHVLAMFLPSFLTGLLIQKVGAKNVICTGLLMLLGSTVLNIVAPTYFNMIVALIVLGVGWNFTYVGGGALLNEASPEEARCGIQGKNDLAIAVCATVGAFAPSILLDIIGWEVTNLLSFIACASLLITTIFLIKRKSFLN